MKKSIAIFLCVTLIAAVAVGVALVVGAEEPTKIVYVSDSGSDSNTGLSADSPYQLLSTAYAALGEEGGIIRIVGTLTNEAYQITLGFWEPAHSGKIIIEGWGDSPKWHFMNASGKVRSRFYANGETEIRNINIHHDNGGLIGACHNTLTIGDGVVMSGSGTLYLFGGCSELASTLMPQSAHTTNDTHLIVKSGTFESITAGDYKNTTTDVCYATGAVHTLEIRGDVKTDYIVVGHNAKTNAGVTANIIIDGNITPDNASSPALYFGGTTEQRKIDRVNVLVEGGSIAHSTVNAGFFNGNGGVYLYADEGNADAVALAESLEAKLTASLKGAVEGLDDWCEGVIGGHDYDDGFCIVCSAVDTSNGSGDGNDEGSGDENENENGNGSSEGTYDPSGERVYFVRQGANGSGNSPEDPAGDLAVTYYAIGDEDATIVIMGDLSLADSFTEPVHKGRIKMIGSYAGTDYNGAVVLVGGCRWILSGRTEFYDIDLKITANADGGKAVSVVCHFNPVVFGEGFETSGGEFYVIGGVNGSADKTGFDEEKGCYVGDVSITMLSGYAVEIVGFAKQGCAGSFDGNVEITVGGDADVSKLCAGTRAIDAKITLGSGKVTLDGGRILSWMAVTDKKNASGFTKGYKVYVTENFDIGASFKNPQTPDVIGGISGSSVFVSNAGDRAGATALYIEAGVYDEVIASGKYSAASFDNINKVGDGGLSGGADTGDMTSAVVAVAAVSAAAALFIISKKRKQRV